MFALVIALFYRSSQVAQVQVDANEYLITHGMVQNIPSFCVAHGEEYVCRGSSTVYLRCKPRPVLSYRSDANRCSPVEIPAQR